MAPFPSLHYINYRGAGNYDNNTVAITDLRFDQRIRLRECGFLPQSSQMTCMQIMAVLEENEE